MRSYKELGKSKIMKFHEAKIVLIKREYNEEPDNLARLGAKSRLEFGKWVRIKNLEQPSICIKENHWVLVPMEDWQIPIEDFKW